MLHWSEVCGIILFQSNKKMVQNRGFEAGIEEGGMRWRERRSLSFTIDGISDIAQRGSTEES